jgi:hypothetical protein
MIQKSIKKGLNLEQARREPERNSWLVRWTLRVLQILGVLPQRDAHLSPAKLVEESLRPAKDQRRPNNPQDKAEPVEAHLGLLFRMIAHDYQPTFTSRQDDQIQSTT